MTRNKITCGCYKYDYYKGIMVGSGLVICADHNHKISKKRSSASEIRGYLSNRMPTVIFREKYSQAAEKFPHQYNHIKSDWSLDAYIKRSTAREVRSA